MGGAAKSITKGVKKASKILPNEINPTRALRPNTPRQQTGNDWNPSDEIARLQQEMENQRRMYEQQYAENQRSYEEAMRNQDSQRARELEDMRNSMAEQMAEQQRRAQEQLNQMRGEAENRQRELQEKAAADLARAEEARKAQETAARNRQAYMQSLSAAQNETQVQANRDNTDESAQAGKMPNPVNDDSNTQRKRRLGGRPSLLGGGS